MKHNTICITKNQSHEQKHTKDYIFDKSLQESKMFVYLFRHQIDGNGGPPVRANSLSYEFFFSFFCFSFFG